MTNLCDFREVTVSFEALKQVINAEDEAQQEKLAMEENVQFAINETIKAGEEAVAATLARAEVEVGHLFQATGQKATEEARILASKTANRQATQRARAERLLDTAANFVYERIVNS